MENTPHTHIQSCAVAFCSSVRNKTFKDPNTPQIQKTTSSIWQDMLYYKNSTQWKCFHGHKKVIDTSTVHICCNIWIMGYWCFLILQFICALHVFLKNFKVFYNVLCVCLRSTWWSRVTWLRVLWPFWTRRSLTTDCWSSSRTKTSLHTYMRWTTTLTLDS